MRGQAALVLKSAVRRVREIRVARLQDAIYIAIAFALRIREGPYRADTEARK
jgi:hypothetical protein